MAQNLYVDGTEMSMGDKAWPNQLVRQFDKYVLEAEPYKSSERVLQSFFGFVSSLGHTDEVETEMEIRSCVFVIEFPDPYNQTCWIPEYGTHVNISPTGEYWIADKEMRENPTDHFNELLEKQKTKLDAWTKLRGDREVYNEQAKAINTIVLFCRAFHTAARIIIKDQNHMPDGDAIKSVYHPYMITKTHWYMPMPSEVLESELGEMEGNELTEKGHAAYGQYVPKRFTRENIKSKK